MCCDTPSTSEAPNSFAQTLNYNRGEASIDCQIITNISQIEAIADEWRALHSCAGLDPFSDYDMVRAWWGTTGQQNDSYMLHVVVARRDKGLVAVLPLVVVKIWGLRILRGVGNNTERFCDLLSKDDIALNAVWREARQSRAYDFAICRGVYPESVSWEILAACARKRDELDEYRLQSKWSGGREWMASLSQKTRYNFNRSTRRMTEKGPVKLEIYEDGPVPVHVIVAMIKAKREWCISQNKSSWVDEPGALDYVHEVSCVAAQQNRLFLAWLTCGEDIVAFQQGYLYQSVLYGEFTAYDPLWWHLSPGHVINVNTIRWAIEAGYKTINLGPGDGNKRDDGENLFKAKYSNEIVIGAEFTFARSARGRILEKAYFATRTLWRAYRRKFDLPPLVAAGTTGQSHKAIDRSLGKSEPELSFLGNSTAGFWRPRVSVKVLAWR